MARHDGIIPLSGQIGEFVFVQRKGQRYVKAKQTKRIQQTEASKNSSTDFGEASKAAAKIRNIFKPLFVKYGDYTLVNRLNSRLMSIFKTIPAAQAGSKKLGDGDLNLLRSLEINKLKRLDALLSKAPVISILPNGEIKIVIGGGKPSNLFKQVDRAISVVLELMVYNMDLNGDNDQILPGLPLVIPFEDEFAGATLRLPLDLDGERLVMVGIGIHYLSKEFEIGARNTRAGGIIFSAKFIDGIEVPFIPIEAKPVKAETKVEGTGWVVGKTTDC